MAKEKAKIIVGKKSFYGIFTKGSSLKDINGKTFEQLAEIFEGKAPDDYKGEENNDLIIAELTIFDDRTSEIKQI